VEQGIAYACTAGITSALNFISVAPFGAHWTYAAASGNRLISPAISTPGATKLYRALINEVIALGGGEQNMGTEPYRLLARTSGITDNTGSWTLLPVNGDLSGISATGTIQFAFEFKTIGTFCMPARIIGGAVLYETSDNLDPRLLWNFDDSDKTTGTVGFIQKSLMSGVPYFAINYFRNDTDANVLSQNSNASPVNGVFEYWSGSAWVTGTGTDTVGLRRRFRPIVGLPSNVAVYPKLTTF
jgi:hypothetical protein